MEIAHTTRISVSKVTRSGDSSPEDLLALLPGIHNNRYLSDRSKALLMSLVGAVYATSGTITALTDDLDQISMYVDVSPDSVVVML